MLDKHDTIGKDIVNHCIDDILVYGAKPLFFLDYIATGKLKPDTVVKVVSGILDACLENDFILLGGETAEMPGFYKDNEYDLAGFIVGLIDKDQIIDGKGIASGDLMIGLPSSGLHTNGYSLARHIVFDKLKLKVDSTVDDLKGTVGEELLIPHLSYLKPVQELLKENLINGIAHITGGGFYDNIPRILPPSLTAQIEKTWPVPDIFNFLVKAGGVGREESFRVFNMGIGMVLIINKNNLSRIETILNSMKEKYYLIGQIIPQKTSAAVRINFNI